MVLRASPRRSFYRCFHPKRNRGLLCIVYWLMVDNITFATDLVAAETRSLLHQEAEKTATKIAVAAVAAAAAADNACAKHKRDEVQFRKRASSFIVN